MFTIAPPLTSDVSVLLDMICELADFEKLTHTVTATSDGLYNALFGTAPVAAALLARKEATPAGFALYYRTYSTFVGRPGIYLEDIYVREQYRRQGLGQLLFSRIAQIAVAENAGRLEWAVLNWNQPARDFYESLGAVPLSEWTTMRLSGEELKAIWKLFPKTDT